MRVFFDTSTLAKRYIEEKGTDKLQELLLKAEEVIVAPIFLIEFYALLRRRVRQRDISQEQFEWIKGQIQQDLDFFSQTAWDIGMVQRALDLIDKYPLSTLDAIQLAGACLAKPDAFVTSDKQLFAHACHEIKNVLLI